MANKLGAGPCGCGGGVAAPAKQGCGCGSGGSDCCTCGPTLASLERPRFFSGQLLNDTDLGALLDYMRAKDRLHNRYLHGPGVVCGLALGCDPCQGYVTVGTGYAISHCGYDILVGEPQRFDVVAAINACLAAAKKHDPCDPYQPGNDDPCGDLDEHWLITLGYREQQRKLTTVLKQAPKKNGTDCGCGCGGKSNGCGTTTVPTGPLDCEATRIVECFELGVRRHCGELCQEPETGTYQQAAAACHQAAVDTLGKHLMSATEWNIFGSQAPVASSAQARFQTLCHARKGLLELLTGSPVPTACAQLRELAQLTIGAPLPGETASAYQNRVEEIRLQLLDIFTRHLQRDCPCFALLMPCSPCPPDDHIVLGSVTVNSGEIVEVCSHAGRRYAGSFPLAEYWMLFGDSPWTNACQTCCEPEPTHELQNNLLGQLVATGRLPASVLTAAPPAGVDLTELIGRAPATARATLGKADVRVASVKLASAARVPVTELLRAPSVVHSGQSVNQYEAGNKVVGYGLAASEESGS